MSRRAPTLAAISMDATGGGVAMVARLLWEVFERQFGSRARLLTLVDTARQPAFPDKARYALRLAAAQVSGATDWMLFSHLGLAKPLGAMPAAWRTPYAIFLHGVEAWRPLTRGERRLLAGAELRLANSNYTASRVMTLHPEIGPVVPCPLALPAIETTGDLVAGRSPVVAHLGGHVVLTVGRMFRAERYKGHDELIDAWPRVLAVVPDAQLVIAGDGDDLARLRAKAARTCTNGSIVFTGFVSRAALVALYERAALFALPSRGEGFGLVYLEAMSHRLACVGSTNDAAGEVIVDERTGRLVDQRNLVQISETIAGLLLDEARRTEMGRAGYERLASEFSFSRFNQRLCALMSVTPPAPTMVAS